MALNILKRIADLKAYSLEVFFDNVQGLVKAAKHREFNNAIFDVLCPVGSITMYAGSVFKDGYSIPPAGWLICNGQTLSSATYPDLYAILGTTYGTAGAGTFKVPDLTLRVPIGQEPWTSIGKTGGEWNTTLTVTQIPTHRHGMPITTTERSGNVPGNIAGGGPAAQGHFFDYTQVELRDDAGAVVTAGQPHNNMPPFITTLFIIKA